MIKPMVGWTDSLATRASVAPLRWAGTPSLKMHAHNQGSSDQVRPHSQIITNTAAAFASDSPSVAVCIAGQLRSFLLADVQHGFARHLHRPNHWNFLSADVRVALNDSRLKIPLHGSVVVSSANTLVPPGTCPPGTVNHRFMLPMAERLVGCYGLIQEAEGSSFFVFDLVLRVRPDHLFFRRFPNVARLREAAPRGEILLFDDQLAAATREQAATLCLAPRTAYSTCAGLREWRFACQSIVRLVQLRQQPPCAPFFLFLVHSNGPGWLPLARLWPGCDAPMSWAMPMPRLGVPKTAIADANESWGRGCPSACEWPSLRHPKYPEQVRVRDSCLARVRDADGRMELRSANPVR